MENRVNANMALQQNAENAVQTGMHSAFQNIVFSWITPEYIESKRGTMWYVFAGTISVLLVLFF